MKYVLKITFLIIVFTSISMLFSVMDYYETASAMYQFNGDGGFMILLISKLKNFEFIIDTIVTILVFLDDIVKLIIKGENK